MTMDGFLEGPNILVLKLEVLVIKSRICWRESNVFRRSSNTKKRMRNAGIRSREDINFIYLMSVEEDFD